MASTPATQARIPGHVYVEQPWLGVLRVLWVVLLIAALALIAISVPGMVQGLVYGAPEMMPDTSYGLARALGVGAVGLNLLVVLLYLGLAGLLFWRRGNHAVSLLFSFTFLSASVLQTGVADYVEYVLPGSSEALLVYGGTLTGWMLPWAFALFPNGRFVPHWMRWAFPIITVLSISLDIAAYLAPESFRWVNQVAPIWLIVMIFAPVYRYVRVSTPAERKQTRWAVFGLVLWAVTLAVLFVPYVVITPDATPDYVDALVGIVWVASTGFLPLAFTIALLRHQLWDVDLVIRRTVQYAAVTAVLAAVYFGTVILMQSALVALTGQRSQLAVVLSTLVIAALFNPVRRRLQQLVDRAFYRKSYDAQQTLAQFGEAVQNEVDIADVEAALLQAVNETLQPTVVGLWLPEGRES